MARTPLNLLPPTSRMSSIERNVWCYFAAFFVLALGIAALGPTLAELAQQTGTGLKEVSILFSMRALGFLCTARIIGWIYDKSKGHSIMSLALVSLSLLSFYVPLAANLAILSPVMFCIGVAGAFIDLGGNILILWAVKNDTGPSLNGLHFAFGLGAFVSPLLVAFALIFTGAGVYVYWIISALCLPVALWIYKTPDPPHPVVSKKYDNPPPLHPAILGLIVLFFFLYAGSEQSFGGWIHTYGVHQNGMADVTASYLTSIFWGTLTAGRLLAIPLVMWIKSHHLIIAQMIGATCTFALMLGFPDSSVVTWMSAGLAGLLLSSIFPLALSFLERYTAGSGRTTSWFFIGASSGGMIVPWLIGQYFESQGPQVFPMFLLICMVSGTSGIIWIVRLLKGQ